VFQFMYAPSLHTSKENTRPPNPPRNVCRAGTVRLDKVSIESSVIVKVPEQKSLRNLPVFTTPQTNLQVA
jgi:hypothetical protein